MTLRLTAQSRAHPSVRKNSFLPSPNKCATNRVDLLGDIGADLTVVG